MIRRFFRFMEGEGDGTGGDGAGGGGGAGGDGAGGNGDAGGGGAGGGPAGSGDGGGGGGGPSTEDWRASLPAELKDDPTIQQTPDLETAAKRLVDAQRFAGQAIRIPGETADAEAWKQFYARLDGIPGVARLPGPESSEEERKAFFGKLAPKAPEEYQFSFAGTDDKGNQKGPPAEMVTEYAKQAHALGLTQEQADGLGKWMTESADARANERKERWDKGMSALLEEFGEDGLKQRQNLAKAVLQKFGKEGDGELLVEAIEQNPALIRILGEIGVQFGEAIDAGIHQGGSDEMDMTTAQIDRRLDEIRADKAFLDNEDPRHKTLMQEYERLGKVRFDRQQAAANRAA